MAEPAAPWFEGLYFKHQKGDETLAVIPGISLDKTGGTAFIQVITNRRSWYVSYPATAFQRHPSGRAVRVGDSLFTQDGVRLNLQSPGLCLRGVIRYGWAARPQGDIMGPFRFVPHMECRHQLFSLGHQLSGSVWVNGRKLSFDGGTGYIEGDRGRSFPSRYTWSQCNTFSGQNTCVFLSAARIPLAGGAFPGCIASVLLQGREYRLATYTGARITRWEPGHIQLTQGNSRLEAELLHSSACPLAAPSLGRMTRIIHEHAACIVRYRFTWQGKDLFDLQSASASFEETK